MFFHDRDFPANFVVNTFKFPAQSFYYRLRVKFPIFGQADGCQMLATV